MRVTNEQIIAAYKETGSIWKAAKLLGVCGQSVWERLKRIGYPLYCEGWTEDDTQELKQLAPECTIGEIARRLGRPYAGVASRISRLGIGVRFGNRQKLTLKRGSGLTKATTAQYLKELINWDGSVRQFCVQRGLHVETFIKALQMRQPDGWEAYVRSHSDLEVRTCPQCKRSFLPMNAKQTTCSRRCSTNRRVDIQYFGGKRSFAIGMEEGICQLCEKEKPRLSAHHMFGKEHDPDNEYMIALCSGCHSLVGTLGVRSDVLTSEFWENLISLAVIRKLGHRKPLGFHVCVEIEELTQEDIDAEVA